MKLYVYYSIKKGLCIILKYIIIIITTTTTTTWFNKT